ncbi:hypothetical protein RND71_010990 [Anisodus tanguticus]|uniref:Uncharacterized protein n=1 Tax=Anisodus tanguticus TaxID=243964 RepID=A0AAE1VT54_9SOLA|nr:hypothetical protein RND71_010990 [Anisodus tanguticus]
MQQCDILPERFFAIFSVAGVDGGQVGVQTASGVHLSKSVFLGDVDGLSKQQTGPVKNRASPNTKKKKKNVSNFDGDVSEINVEVEEKGLQQSSERYHPLPLPKPPAGFVLDEQGRVLMASNRRIATIVDSTNNFPLECVIRRVFRSTRGDECLLLCPVDMPVQILKSTNVEGWAAVHSVTQREEDVATQRMTYLNLEQEAGCTKGSLGVTGKLPPCDPCDQEVMGSSRGNRLLQKCEVADDGEDVDGLPSEGIEITCFHMDGSHYMIYTPSDPLLFVAVKDKDGQLQIADDELLEDPAIISAIDEETEFNALVEEEAALLESLLGERD